MLFFVACWFVCLWFALLCWACIWRCLWHCWFESCELLCSDMVLYFEKCVCVHVCVVCLAVACSFVVGAGCMLGVCVCLGGGWLCLWHVLWLCEL